MYEVVTEWPVAVDSLDHLRPHGVRNDNSKNPLFCLEVINLFGPTVRVLDLGCAGGGMVADFVALGCDAVGLEGSDYNLLRKRAEWATIPDRLFTCDCSRPFRVLKDGSPVFFDVVTAWELLEHVPEQRLRQTLENVRRHLTRDGLFLASVPYDVGKPNLEPWHVTWKPRAWWDEFIVSCGFEPSARGARLLASQRVRGEVETSHAWRVG